MTTHAEPPRHARFQIHLSTAIVLMFVAGGLMWANISCYGFYEHFPQGRELEYMHYRRRIYGFPLPAVDAWQDMEKYHGRSDVTFVPNRYSCIPVFIAVDVLTCATILTATWLFCEWLIRCRAARK
ncbi:MAG TPA: hypothetical protein VKX17_24065 [Planctomycetota bacterium]|nr:hypothetical protein [Planctomycetota bacterium]